jgi:DNA repair exonuclease SbcCD ATPase subunit
MPKQQTITERSRKADILKAYEGLKMELEELKKGPEPVETTVRAETAHKVGGGEKAAVVPEEVEAGYAPEGLIRGISSLKITIANALGDLESRLVEEAKRLESIRKEIREGKKMLKEVYDIELEAESLAELKRKQEDEKARFEKEMEEARARWEHEKKAREERLKEEEAEIRRKQQWEKDEYEYQLKVRKQRDTDTLEAELKKRQVAFEEDLRGKEKGILEREAAVKEREEELARLQKEVEQFPKTLETRVREAEKEAVRATEERFKMEKYKADREMARLKEISELTAKGLQEKIKEQSARLQNIEQDLKEAQAQTHQVATRAVEAVARIPFKMSRVEEREED